jgi:hypothetical protein
MHNKSACGGLALGILIFCLCDVAKADLNSLPTEIQMRCGPADPVVTVKLSTAIANAAKCQPRLDGMGELTQTGTLTVAIGPNIYDAKIFPDTDQTCADLDNVHLAISDGYSTYTLTVGKNQSIIGDGHGVVCKSK